MAVINYTFLSYCNLIGIEIFAEVIVIVVDYIHLIYTYIIYILFHCLPNVYHRESLLDFWRVRSTDYPTLASLARRVFSVPATSAPVERVFSQAPKSL